MTRKLEATSLLRSMYSIQPYARVGTRRVLRISGLVCQNSDPFECFNILVTGAGGRPLTLNAEDADIAPSG